MSKMEDIQEESKSGSYRVNFWLATVEVLPNDPFGVRMGYQILNSPYIYLRWTEADEAKKAVLSSWFQALGDLGWLGIILLVKTVVSTFQMTRKAFRTFISSHHRCIDYFFLLTFEYAFLRCFIVGSFIDRLWAAILYWLLIYYPVAYKFHILVRESEPLPVEPIKAPASRYRSRERTT